MLIVQLEYGTRLTAFPIRQHDNCQINMRNPGLRATVYARGSANPRARDASSHSVSTLEEIRTLLVRSGAMEDLMDNAYSGLGLGNVTIVSSQPHLLSTCMASGDGEIAPCSVEFTTVRVSIRPFRDAFAGICCIFSSLDRATSIPVRADSPLPLLDAVCSCVPAPKQTCPDLARIQAPMSMAL